MTKKRAFIIVFYLVLTVAVLWFVQRLVMPKYQYGIVEGAMAAEYYEADEPHEVIFVGDCEVYEAISPVTLYEEYGISSYIRGSAQQLVWQSYYLLEDALRYETPKVVVFNVLALKYDEPQSETYNRMTIDGMRLSPSKIGIIEESMTPGEKMVEYIFPILRYHSRWSELDQDDWDYLWDRDRVTHNGYYMRVDIKPEAEFPEPPLLTDYSLGDNAMYWLGRMADLCAENDIELVLIKSPIKFPFWYDQWDQQVSAFARSRGLTYINFIDARDDMGLDMTRDTYDAGLHLNLTGAEKFARYLGAILDESYDLTDYREVPEVAAEWEDICEAYHAMAAAQYQELIEYGYLRNWGSAAVEMGRP